MDKPQPFPDPQSHGSAQQGGFVAGAPPGSVPIPPPPWSLQPGNWPPFQPPGGPPMYPHPPPHLPPHPPPFDLSRPPPGYFGEQQPGPWSHPSGRGQQHQVLDRGQFDQGVPFTPFGPPPPLQSRFQPVRPGLNFSEDHHELPSTFQIPPGSSTKPVVEDEEAKQGWQDEQWVRGFLKRRAKQSAAPQPTAAGLSVFDFKQKLSGAVQTLSELSRLCQTLKDNLENEAAWSESYSRAMELRSSLQERLAALQDREVIERVQKKLELIKKKRARLRRRKAERAEEKEDEERRAAERAAAIDKFQMKQIQALEEKNRERELKLAADAVLSEVRKKQADAKRMTDILKALEKLRKLRKEAASRRGMFPEKECDEVFEGHLVRLRSLIRKRTAIYGAEEKALRVMLEGEQEEERKRDREKRLKKEREKLLLKKQEIDTMLFGAELPPGHLLQPFLDYYTQAEHSLPALIQIRREWDQFLVPVDHPDGTSIPQGWVLPDPPADDVWATALEK